MDKRKRIYEEFFQNAFLGLKQKFSERYGFADERDVSPEMVAIRDAINSLFPCHLDILELETGDKKIYQLIKYDISRSRDPSVELHGKIKTDEIEQYSHMLGSVFDLSASGIEDLKNLSLAGWSRDDVPYIGDLPCFDILANPEEYVEHLLFLILDVYGSTFIQRFKKEIDYNSIYNLDDDPIIPFGEIIKKEPILNSVRRSWQSVEDPQKNICNIHLIPSVPESVKKVFQTTKDLYVFGYFKYSFFTVSKHYAYLALESAIVNRYDLSLPKQAIISHKDQKETLAVPTHQKIWDLCSRKRWNFRKLKVNGEPFPYSRNKIIEWMLEKGVIGNWEKQVYFENLISLRNSFSHLTSHIITMPDYNALAVVADNINKLFHEKKWKNDAN